MEKENATTIGIYLNEISKIPLLTNEEENFLVRKIAESNGSSEKYKAQLIKSNLRLVVSVTKKFYSRGLEFLDLVQEGNMGLMRSIETYDPSVGTKFNTYATWWIKAFIRRAIRGKSRTIRIPSNIFDKARKVEYAKSQIQQQTGVEPTINELSDRLNISPIKIKIILKILKSPLHISENEEYVYELEDKTVNPPSDVVNRAQLKANLEKILNDCLSNREREILYLNFGWNGGEGFSLRDLSQIYGMTHEGIRYIKNTAIRRANVHLIRCKKCSNDYIEA